PVNAEMASGRNYVLYLLVQIDQKGGDPARLQTSRAMYRDREIAHCRQLATRFPNSVHWAIQLGLAYLRHGQPKDAAPTFRRAIELNPKSAEAYQWLAVTFEQKGEFVRAIEHYRKALQHDPTLARAHNGLGHLLGKRGEKDEAMRCYQRAIQH